MPAAMEALACVMPDRGAQIFKVTPGAAVRSVRGHISVAGIALHGRQCSVAPERVQASHPSHKCVRIFDLSAPIFVMDGQHVCNVDFSDIAL